MDNRDAGAPDAGEFDGTNTTADAVKRAVRTFVQGFLGVLVIIAIPALNSLVQAVAGGGEVEIDVNFWQGVGVAAVAGGVIALISYLQNELEHATGSAILPK